MVAGYPDLQTSLEAFRSLLKGGTDVLEVGLPFSDPVADGPTIQRAHDLALKGGVKLKDVLNITKTLKEEFPERKIILMSYYNPIFRRGEENFARLCKENGIDGLIVPDLPVEEALPLKETLNSLGLSLILLASPTSGRRRLKKICENTDLFTYLISVTGTTGMREKLPLERIRERVKILKGFCPKKKVVVGFGISSKEKVKEISSFCDGVVVGSFFVKLSGDGKLEEIYKFAREFKGVLEGGDF